MKAWKRFKDLSSKPHFWPILIVIFFGLLAGRGLIGVGYFNMHDDLQMMRQLEMEKCFLDWQIPCRWIPDMGYGFGYPLFNFYPPLPYLVGQGIRLLGYSFTATVKIVFISSFVVSGITMYLLAKEFFGRLGGIVSAVFYIWAPYHAVDVYVRGAMNEAWALMWFPLILWTTYKLITEKKIQQKWIIGLALSWFALFTSHNLMVLVFAPFFSAWCLIWLYWYKKWERIPQLAISGIWSFGLAAFFTLPVLFEKGIVQTDSLVVGYYEYTAHFANLNQLLFSRFWGYGPSVWMALDDGMSFQVGLIHWGLSLVVLVYLISQFVQRKKLTPFLIVISFMFVLGWFTAFMAHSKSTPIWNAIGPLAFVQFPWRFLTMVILGFSFISGAVVTFSGKFGKLVGILLIIMVVLFSKDFFVPEHGKLGPLTDEEKFKDAAWELQQTAGIYDYLPNTAVTAPKAPRGDLVEIIEGEGTVSSVVEGTDWAKFTLRTEAVENIIRINILAFPNWKVTVNDYDVETFIPETEQWGRMYINLPRGDHKVSVKLHNTPVRIVGNLVSLLSWGIFGVIIFKKKNNPSRK